MWCPFLPEAVDEKVREQVVNARVETHLVDEAQSVRRRLVVQPAHVRRNVAARDEVGAVPQRLSRNIQVHRRRQHGDHDVACPDVVPERREIKFTNVGVDVRRQQRRSRLLAVQVPDDERQFAVCQSSNARRRREAGAEPVNRVTHWLFLRSRVCWTKTS